MDKVDQRGFDNQSSTTLSGREAAAFLGVKRETLYAYASRGLLRSEPGGPGRERRYLRDDLLRLKARHDARAGHGPVAASALRWGEPVLSSALTAIDDDGPIYRGYAAASLSRRAAFEAVAELLWGDELPGGEVRWEAGDLGVSLARLAALVPAGAHPHLVLALAVPALGAADPARAHTAVEVEKRRARSLIMRMAALAGLGREEGRAAVPEALRERSVARALLRALGAKASALGEAAVNRALVVSADHELNASTFGVRVAASTGADLYACLSAGIATLSGPLHGGASDQVEALMAEAGRPEEARATVNERARRGEAIPGFGHTLYAEGDPRAAPLIEIARDLGPKRLPLRTLLALVEATRDTGRGEPTIDVGLCAVRAALGLPPGSAGALFAIGRAAGWVAHALEQRAQGFMLRPRARYVGPAKRGG
ncbi:MAG: citrate synthase family protein [Byssovorax sp.]